MHPNNPAGLTHGHGEDKDQFWPIISPDDLPHRIGWHSPRNKRLLVSLISVAWSSTQGKSLIFNIMSGWLPTLALASDPVSGHAEQSQHNQGYWGLTQSIWCLTALNIFTKFCPWSFLLLNSHGDFASKPTVPSAGLNQQHKAVSRERGMAKSFRSDYDTSVMSFVPGTSFSCPSSPVSWRLVG